MNKNARLSLMLLVTGYIVTQLLWQYFMSSVPKHHLLNDASLPAISNWWGLIILPALTWILCTYLNKKHGKSYPRKIWLQMAGASAYAALVSILFYSGYVELLALLTLPSILLAAFLVPIYKAPFLLAYVVVASIGFGSVIPLIAGLVFAAAGYVVYTFIRPLPIYLIKLLTKAE